MIPDGRRDASPTPPTPASGDFPRVLATARSCGLVRVTGAGVSGSGMRLTDHGRSRAMELTGTGPQIARLVAHMQRVADRQGVTPVVRDFSLHVNEAPQDEDALPAP